MLVADVQGWAFDINERDMAKYCGHRWDFDHWYISQRGAPPSTHAAHAVFLPYHRWGTDACWSGVPLLGSLRSADFDPDRPGHLCAMDESFVQRCAGFHVVTREAEDRLRQYRNVVYLTNPVDCSRFDRSTEVDGLVVCFAGNPAHSTSQQDDVKGLRSIIIPACATLRIDLVTAEFAKRLPPSEMPSFYRRGSVYVCASAYEGASNAVMEAMASGLAVIATDVGNHREMRDSQIEHFGASGIMLVERSLDAVMDALRALTPRSVRDMGQINRQEILDRWSWAMWADRYLEFLGMAL
jgi:glycosyltransferase involved in cell wall biosynthesis